jgi:dipeptidyl aminopeptidase/acylaminoacyl peptidase
MKDLLPIIVAALVGAVAIFTLQSSNVTPIVNNSEFREYSIQEFLDNTIYFGASFSPDGKKILASSGEYGIPNAFAVPVDGSRIQKLTSSNPDRIFRYSYFPNDERFIFHKDAGGNELIHAFVRELDGSVYDLTPGDGFRSNFQGFTADGSKMYIRSSERDPRLDDIYEYDTTTYERELIYTNDNAYAVAGISPDGRYFALFETVTNADANIHIFDKLTGETTLITPHEGDASYFPQAFSADNTHLLYASDENSEFGYLMKHDLVTGQKSEVFRANWDVRFATYSPKGTYLAIGINNDASTEVKLLETATMRELPLPGLGNSDITTVLFNKKESGMAFYAASSKRPSELFYWEFAMDKPRRLTTSISESINPDHLVEGEVKRFESFDGVEIPGILYMPKEASPSNKVPALIYVHGGPGGQTRMGYFGLLQYLVNHGYAVYAINNRGSSGYGKTFSHLDDKLHGVDDLEDCVWAKHMLIDTGLIDGDRIGIMGASYGGYMTLAALTFRPEEFAVGVDMFGISNWVRTLANIPPWWEAFRNWLFNEMGPIDDVEFFKAKSPLFHAENIVKPLMVLQGANDPRVLKEESDDIVEAVRANGVPVEYVLFADEGHGFSKKENIEKGNEAILTFLEKYLK